MATNNKKFDWFEPIKVGSIEAKNKLFMASLTRNRGDLQGVGNDLIIEYYKQRAGFGIIFTEASQISEVGHGYTCACGIYSKDQTEFWKKCVSEVHKLGSKMIIQLWHTGRVADSSINYGHQTLSASAIAVSGNNMITQKPYEVPKEMTVEEIKQTIEDYRKAALNAKEAGFDGVELHAANGYLPDQFLKDNSNKRTDQYGGSIQNRIRFTLEAIDALISVYGADKVGIKLSPTGRYLDQYDSNPLQLYSELIIELEKRKIAFIQMKECGDIDASKPPTPGQTPAQEQIQDCCKAFRHLYTGVLMTNDGFKLNEQFEKSFQKCQDGWADAMTVGRLAMSNPDLPQRIQNNWPLNYDINWSKAFGGGETGFTDYPNYKP